MNEVKPKRLWGKYYSRSDVVLGMLLGIASLEILFRSIRAAWKWFIWSTDYESKKLSLVEQQEVIATNATVGGILGLILAILIVWFFAKY